MASYLYFNFRDNTLGPLKKLSKMDNFFERRTESSHCSHLVVPRSAGHQKTPDSDVVQHSFLHECFASLRSVLKTHNIALAKWCMSSSCSSHLCSGCDCRAGPKRSGACPRLTSSWHLWAAHSLSPLLESSFFQAVLCLASRSQTLFLRRLDTRAFLLLQNFLRDQNCFTGQVSKALWLRDWGFVFGRHFSVHFPECLVQALVSIQCRVICWQVLYQLFIFFSLTIALVILVITNLSRCHYHHPPHHRFPCHPPHHPHICLMLLAIKPAYEFFAPLTPTMPPASHLKFSPSVPHVLPPPISCLPVHCIMIIFVHSGSVRNAPLTLQLFTVSSKGTAFSWPSFFAWSFEEIKITLILQRRDLHTENSQLHSKPSQTSSSMRTKQKLRCFGYVS